MAKKVTNKKPLFGNKRSHALNITKRQQKPNLQKSNGVITSAREMKKDKKSSK